MSADSSTTKKRSLKSYASRVFQESSVGVVSSVAQTTSTKRRIFKIFVFILCLTGFLYQSVTYLAYVFQYPTAVDIDVLRPDAYNVPAYTFCDNNRRLFCEKFPDRCEEPTDAFCEKYRDYCGENKTMKPKKEYYFLHDTLPMEDTLDLNVEVDNFVEREGENITGPYSRVKDFEVVYACYILNDRVNNALTPRTATTNKIIRLPVDRIQFRVKAVERFLPSNRAGILFSLHSPFEAENPFETGVFMRPGRKYIIYVNMDEELSQKHPYDTDCMNYTELWEKNGRSGPRSQNMCQQKCLSDLSLMCYGCVSPVFLYQGPDDVCGSTDEFYLNDTCPKDVEPTKKCYDDCRDDCRQTTYRFTVQERFQGHYDANGRRIREMDNVIDVQIYLAGDEVIVYKHTPKYMSQALKNCLQYEGEHGLCSPSVSKYLVPLEALLEYG